MSRYPRQGLRAADFLFTEEATGGPSYAVASVDQANGKFTIAGDHVAAFPADSWFLVAGSTGNDNAYAVVSAVLSGGSTVIETNGAPLASAVANGYIRSPRTYTATLDAPAGTHILDMLFFPLAAPWAADNALLTIGDDSEPAGYIGPADIGQNNFGSFTWRLHTAYGDPTAYNGDFTDGGNLNDAAAASVGGSYSTTRLGILGGRTSLTGNAQTLRNGGPGIRYATGHTITLTVVALIASPPVAPVGELLIRILYFEPVAATDAGTSVPA